MSRNTQWILMIFAIGATAEGTSLAQGNGYDVKIRIASRTKTKSTCVAPSLCHDLSPAQNDSKIESGRIEESDLPGDRVPLPEAAVMPHHGLKASFTGAWCEISTIRERYDDGSIKSERNVAQDEHYNFVSHGPWKMWDKQSRLVCQGNYQYGKRQGEWTRWIYEDDMAGTPFNETKFQAPYISKVTFIHDLPHGMLTVADRHNRAVTSCEIDMGRVHGRVMLWFPNGSQQLEMTYRNGVADGSYRHWDHYGDLVYDFMFREGKLLDSFIDRYDGGELKMEGTFFYSSERPQVTYDWWNGIVEVFHTEGPKSPQRHGEWITWYRNGGRRHKLTFEQGDASGDYGYWFANGQQRATGQFVEDKREGTWAWYHENGQKLTQGKFENDVPVGIWYVWSEEGLVEMMTDFDNQPTKLQTEDIASDEATEAEATAEETIETADAPIEETAAATIQPRPELDIDDFLAPPIVGTPRQTERAAHIIMEQATEVR